MKRFEINKNYLQYLVIIQFVLIIIGCLFIYQHNLKISSQSLEISNLIESNQNLNISVEKNLNELKSEIENIPSGPVGPIGPIGPKGEPGKDANLNSKQLNDIDSIELLEDRISILTNIVFRVDALTEELNECVAVIADYLVYFSSTSTGLISLECIP
tara:strand:+ start:111 stop:584 length:474 start_codon:yes stop_codon:yes gene_type:complete